MESFAKANKVIDRSVVVVAAAAAAATAARTAAAAATTTTTTTSWIERFDSDKIKEKVMRVLRGKTMELDLRRCGLSKLPDEIGQLTTLTKLDVSHNQLTALPESIGNLVQCEKFIVSNNQLTALPESIENLMKCKLFRADNNQLTALSGSIGNLAQCEMFWVNDNQLTVLPESIGNLVQCKEFNAHFNQLMALPESIGNLVQCKEFYVYNNQLTTLPESIGNLVQCEVFIVSGNQLTALPESIGNLVRCEKFSVSRNQLTVLPESIGNLVQCKKFNGRNNQLTVLPESIGNLVQCEVFLVHHNQLTVLPESIGNLVQCEEFTAFNNQLTALPDEIGQLATLTKLDVSNNQLTVLPDEIGQLTTLTKLDVSHNQLTALPESIGNLVQCKVVHKYTGGRSSSIGGMDVSVGARGAAASITPPSWLDRFDGDEIKEKVLRVLRGETTELELVQRGLAELPDEIGQLTTLTKLDVSRNQLTALPESIGNLVRCKDLNVNRNQLTTLPESIGNLLQCKKFWLSHNQLMALPESIGNLVECVEFVVYDNQLTALPESIGNLTKCNMFRAWDNQFTALPESIGNLVRCKEFNVQKNQLTTLPNSIGNLVLCRVFFVNSNKLTALPETIGNLTNCKKFVVSNNQLTVLPESIGNLTKCNMFRADNNQLTALSGSIGNLAQCKEFYANDNKLIGLPESIGNLGQCEKFYVYNNKLTALPESTGNLVQCKVFWVNNNKLTTLPESIGNLLQCQGKLSSGSPNFDAGNNPLAAPPSEVCSRGLDAVRAWFADRAAQGLSTTHLLKLMLVGVGEAGKTSVFRTLRNNAPSLVGARRGSKFENAAERRLRRGNTTVGVDIETWFPQTDIEFSMWARDFAGQEDYYMTHSLFLSRRSIVVLVVDASTYTAERHNYAAQRWLDAVGARLGGEVEVSVVLTHADAMGAGEAEARGELLAAQVAAVETERREKRQDHERALRRAGSSAEAVVHPGGRRVALGRIFAVSCKDGTGFDALRAELLRLGKARGVALPENWSELLKNLHTMGAKFENVRGGSATRLDWEELLACASACGVAAERARDVVGTLHELGALLWYDDNEKLKNSVFVRPQWLVDVVKRVVRHRMEEHLFKDVLPELKKKKKVTTKVFEGWVKSLCRTQGRLDHALLRFVENWREFDAETLATMLELLRAFDLCYPAADEGTSLVPFYLKPADESDAAVGGSCNEKENRERLLAKLASSAVRVGRSVSFEWYAPEKLFQRLLVRWHRVRRFDGVAHTHADLMVAALGGAVFEARWDEDELTLTMRCGGCTADEAWGLTGAMLSEVEALLREFPGTVQSEFALAFFADEEDPVEVAVADAQNAQREGRDVVNVGARTVPVGMLTPQSAPWVVVPARVSLQQGEEVRAYCQSLVPHGIGLNDFKAAVFVSYATGRREGIDAEGCGPGMLYAKALVNLFANESVDTFTGLHAGAGDNWKTYIKKLKDGECKVLVIVVTPALYASKPCLEEIDTAQSYGAKLLPVLFENPIPAQDDQWAEQRGEDAPPEWRERRARVLKGFGKLNCMPAPPGTVLDQRSVAERVVERSLSFAERVLNETPAQHAATGDIMASRLEEVKIDAIITGQSEILKEQSETGAKRDAGKNACVSMTAAAHCDGVEQATVTKASPKPARCCYVS